MKKIPIFILSLCIAFSLCACSSVNSQDVSVFFNALHKTMQLPSAQITGSAEMTNVTQSKMNFVLAFNQEKNLELSLNVGLQSGKNKVDNYLQFYIKDGKTYLNNLGTKSQSTVENIGLAKDSKLDRMDPFLDFTKEQLAEFFTSTSVSGDTYTLTIEPDNLSYLLDDLQTVTVSKGDITAVINDGIIQSMTLYVEGQQKINDQKANFKILLNAKLKDAGKTTVQFPADLNSY